MLMVKLLQYPSNTGLLFYSIVRLPPISDNRNSTMNIKNRILAMPAAPAAIPPKPNIAAITATIKNITVQRNIG